MLALCWINKIYFSHKPFDIHHIIHTCITKESIYGHCSWNYCALVSNLCLWQYMVKIYHHTIHCTCFSGMLGDVCSNWKSLAKGTWYGSLNKSFWKHLKFSEIQICLRDPFRLKMKKHGECMYTVHKSCIHHVHMSHALFIQTKPIKKVVDFKINLIQVIWFRAAWGFMPLGQQWKISANILCTVEPVLQDGRTYP